MKRLLPLLLVALTLSACAGVPLGKWGERAQNDPGNPPRPAGDPRH